MVSNEQDERNCQRGGLWNYMQDMAAFEVFYTWLWKAHTRLTRKYPINLSYLCAMPNSVQEYSLMITCPASQWKIYKKESRKSVPILGPVNYINND